MNIIKTIDQLQGIVHLSPASEAQVDSAEQELGVTFADEYREYLLTYGVAAATGIELTGIVKSPRLNVVNVTIFEREQNEKIPPSMYVVESTGMEGLVILQDQTGAVYSAVPNQEPKRIFDSLTDYLMSL